MGVQRALGRRQKLSDRVFSAFAPAFRPAVHGETRKSQKRAIFGRTKCGRNIINNVSNSQLQVLRGGPGKGRFLQAFGQLWAPLVASSGTLGSPMEPHRRKKRPQERFPRSSFAGRVLAPKKIIKKSRGGSCLRQGRRSGKLIGKLCFDLRNHARALAGAHFAISS